MNTRYSNISGEHVNSYTPMPQINPPKGITKNEMLEMRASGMSNTGISKSLECPRWKVDKLIGKTPKSVKDAILADVRAKKSVVHTTAKEPDISAQQKLPAQCENSNGLKKTIAHMILSGRIAEYHISFTNVRIGIGDSVIVLAASDLEALIGELLEVMDEAIKLKRL